MAQPHLLTSFLFQQEMTKSPDLFDGQRKLDAGIAPE